MGYDLIIRVACDGITEKDLIDFDNGTGALKEMKTIYKELRKSEALEIEVGKEVHTTSGYCGSDKNFVKQITKFTSKFPKYTFRIYYSAFDFEHLRIFTIKNQTLLGEEEVIVEEKIKTSNGNVVVTPRFDALGFKIKHEITSYLNHWYEYDFVFDFETKD